MPPPSCNSEPRHSKMQVQPPSRTSNSNQKRTLPQNAFQHQQQSGTSRPNQPNSSTIYIGDSIFTDFDPLKLSSEQQEASVFHFNGSDAKRMHNKIKFNERLKALQKESPKVYRAFLLCGANDVENIQLVKGNMLLDQVKQQLKTNVELILQMFPQATLGLVNILPRADPAKQQVANELNDFLENLSTRYGNRVNLIDTYHNGLLSSKRGKERIARFFRSVHPDDTDNVHLNLAGAARLAKHLKFIAHKGYSQFRTSR